MNVTQAKKNKFMGQIEQLIENRERRWSVAVTISLAIIVIGLVLLGFAGVRFFTAERGIGILIPAATLIVAGLTALMAQFGITSWYEQRREDRAIAEYSQRQGVYTRASNLLVSHFNGTFDAAKDAELRSLIAIWGSANVLEKFGDWQQFISTLHVAPGVKTSLDIVQQIQSKNHIGAIMSEIRKDLLATGNDSVDPRLIIRSIFNEDS